MSGGNKLKVLILSSSNPYKIAGIVAKDLLESLNADKSIKATLLVRVWGKYLSEDIVSYDSVIAYYFDWIKRKVKGVLRLIGIYSKDYKRIKNTNQQYIVRDIDQTRNTYSSGRILKKYADKPDVIIVLFMSKFLTYKNLHELNKLTGAPILLYMMDMAPFTGICHYSWNCEGYQNSCGNCPALFSDDPADQSFINLAFKKNYADKTNIIPVVASQMQFLQASKSHLFGDNKIYKILLAVNEKQYFPNNKLISRQKLSLPGNGKILFFGAGSFAEKRKGLEELLLALNILSQSKDFNQPIHLAIAGNNKEIVERSLPFPYTLLGQLNHQSLPVAYSAADVFICPSVQDSGPMMINQSLMCGTPVVSFEMGVALDLVINGITGYKARLKDSEELAKGIGDILKLDEDAYGDLASNCRRIALNEFSLSSQLRGFKQIFSETVKWD